MAQRYIRCLISRRKSVHNDISCSALDSISMFRRKVKKMARKRLLVMSICLINSCMPGCFDLLKVNSDDTIFGMELKSSLFCRN